MSTEWCDTHTLFLTLVSLIHTTSLHTLYLTPHTASLHTLPHSTHYLTPHTIPHSTHCFTSHTASLYTLPHSTHCLTPHTISLHTLPHSTHCLTPHTASLHTLLHSTHCLTPHTALLHTLSHSTHCLTPHTALHSAHLTTNSHQFWCDHHSLLLTVLPQPLPTPHIFLHVPHAIMTFILFPLLPAAFLQSKPSEADIRTHICQKAGCKWPTVCTYLGVSFAQVQMARGSNPHQEEDACFEAVMHWKKGNTSVAVSWARLLEALKRAGLGGIADSITRQYRVEPVSAGCVGSG